MRGFSRGIGLLHPLQLYDFCGILELTTEKEREDLTSSRPFVLGYIGIPIWTPSRLGRGRPVPQLFHRLTRTWANKGNVLKPDCLFSDTGIRTANERDKANFPLQKLPDQCVGCFHDNTLHIVVHQSLGLKPESSLILYAKANIVSGKGIVDVKKWMNYLSFCAHC
jgi:hypothetical protein